MNYLTARKTAKFLKISQEHLLEKVRHGLISFSILDKNKIIFSEKDIQEYLRRPTVELDLFIELICKYHILN